MKKLVVALLVIVGGYWAYRVWADSQVSVSVWDEATDTIA
ncbi:MAG: DLW-39 family protein [Bifidobacteriaceae bacterium]|jgi:predicted negative regulator of RcsB-dependent stress response|nr:DLW-39 family protein [Bifidobacteriaceae bacterium]